MSVSVSITKNSLRYNPAPAQFQITMNGQKGVSPGAITVSQAGTDVDFPNLVTPGFAMLKNLDDLNWVEYGIRDPATHVFYPLGKIDPGQEWPIYFSPNLREDYYNTGTGTTGPINHFHMKAHGGPVNVSVEAFES